MEISVCDSYKILSKRVAIDIIQHTQPLEEPLVCIATGETPKGLYKELRERYNQNSLDISNWRFIELDEWLDLENDCEGSCLRRLNQNLFKPLNVNEEKVCCFDGKTNNPDDECQRVESFLQSYGPIDVAVIGLGMNGHVGFNEPGTDPSLRSHVSELDSVTKQVSQKYFSKSKQLSKGITLGLADLREAKRLILIVSGHKKATIVQQVLEEKISKNLPATLLRDHLNFTVYLDSDAANLLHPI